MKILLTGANGFLGRACQPVLRGAGHKLVTTDRHGAVEITGDLSVDGFCATLPDADAVVHCAAVQYVSPDLPSWSRQPYFEKNNVVATTRLAERYKGRETHFVNIGTSMMYKQDGSSCYSVNSPMAAQGAYSRSKLRAQHSVQAFLPRWATVIPCIIGGVGREGLFRGFVESMLKWGLVVFPGRGGHPVHMVHVEDAASLILRVVETRAAGFFNAASPGPLSINQWIAEIGDALGVPPPKVVRLPLTPLHRISAMSGYRLLAREQLLMLRYPHVLDITASLELGWHPAHDNAQIARSIGTYVATSQR